jgi:hypothetical protein
MIGSSHDSEIFRKRIHPQIIAPSQFNVLEHARGTLNSGRRRRAIRKNQMTIHSHKESGRIGKVLAPRNRTILRNIVGHNAHKSSHIGINGCSERRRHKLRLAVFHSMRAESRECQ